MTINQAIKDRAIDLVRKGSSYKRTSEFTGIPIMTVRYWCLKAGVKSQHTRPVCIVSDDDMLKTISDFRALTQREIKEILGYKSNAGIKVRLSRMVMDGRVKYIRLSGGGKASRFLRDYVDRRVYYVSDNDLHKWLEKLKPDDITDAEMHSFSCKMGEIGL